MNNNKLELSLQQQISLQQFINKYNKINGLEVINYLKSHLEQYKKQHNISYRDIAYKLNVSIHTIYLKVCNFLKIDITDILLVESEELENPWKWHNRTAVVEMRNQSKRIKNLWIKL